VLVLCWLCCKVQRKCFTYRECADPLQDGNAEALITVHPKIAVPLFHLFVLAAGPRVGRVRHHKNRASKCAETLVNMQGSRVPLR
jgi:hypothetical protein